MQQVEFRDEAHAALHAKAQPDPRAAWEAFVAAYPEWARLGSAWLLSHEEGATPLDHQKAWVTFPALEWLEGFLTPDMRVFEWGSGGSTFFLAKRAGHVVSVEHDQEWFHRVSERLAGSPLPNVERYLIPPEPGEGVRSGLRQYEGLNFTAYVSAIDAVPDASLDFVLIDGRARVDCLSRVLRNKVRTGGAVMLDNSDYTRYQAPLSKLPWRGERRHELCGPGPFSKVIGWCTSAWIIP